jgi:hypothetical protein
MKRTTVFMDEAVARELRLVARRRGRSVAAVVRTAIAREVAAEVHRPLSFVGVGDSGRRDVAARHEELLWKALDPHSRGRGGRNPAKRRARQPSRGKPRR